MEKGLIIRLTSSYVETKSHPMLARLIPPTLPPFPPNHMQAIFPDFDDADEDRRQSPCDPRYLARRRERRRMCRRRKTCVFYFAFADIFSAATLYGSGTVSGASVRFLSTVRFHWSWEDKGEVRESTRSASAMRTAFSLARMRI